MFNIKTEPLLKLVFLSIPILFLISSAMHFLFEVSGKLTVIAAIAPVNESIWEHLKMSFLPILLWWLIVYFLYKDIYSLDYSKWFFAAAISLIVCPFVIVIFYYLHSAGLGIESLFLDIFSLLLAIIAGQFLALHIYRYSKSGILQFSFAVIIIVILALSFAVFTFKPPHLPIFLDNNTGYYGVQK